MPRKPDKQIKQAQELYLKSLKLVDISKQLDLPEGTVRRWKSTYKWDSERLNKNKGASWAIRMLPVTVRQRRTAMQRNMVFSGNTYRKRPFQL